jgi:hypothetical protein
MQFRFEREAFAAACAPAIEQTRLPKDRRLGRQKPRRGLLFYELFMKPRFFRRDA